MNRFANRAAIVTGGGSGIGEATAKRLFAEGASVVVADANGDAARRVADTLGDAGRAYAVTVDVTDRAGVGMMQGASPPDDLPSFENPPISEVVLGVQFAAPGLGVVHVGRFFDRLRGEYPRIMQVPPLPLSFESFSAPGPPEPVLLPAFPAAPFPRQWFISDDDERLVQFQADNLLVNWRRRPGGGDYPRYTKLKAMFNDAMSALRDLLGQDVGDEFRPNQCEITYINIIPIDDMSDLGRPGKWISLWKDNGDGAEVIQFHTQHLLRSDAREPFARVFTAFDGKYIDGKLALQLTLTVRGRPLTQDETGVSDFFDAGHRAIVTRFAQITTNEAHALWRIAV